MALTPISIIYQHQETFSSIASYRLIFQISIHWANLYMICHAFYISSWKQPHQLCYNNLITAHHIQLITGQKNNNLSAHHAASLYTHISIHRIFSITVQCNYFAAVINIKHTLHMDHESLSVNKGNIKALKLSILHTHSWLWWPVINVIIYNMMNDISMFSFHDDIKTWKCKSALLALCEWNPPISQWANGADLDSFYVGLSKLWGK